MLGSDTHLSCCHLLSCQVPLAKAGNNGGYLHQHFMTLFSTRVMMGCQKISMYEAASFSVIQEDMNLLKVIASLTNAQRK